MGWILDGSWIDFGWILGGFWEPSWSQNQSKINEKMIDNKMDVGMDFGWLLDRFLVDFGPKLGGKLEPCWAILGTKMAKSRASLVPHFCFGAEMAPDPLQDLFFNDIGLQLGGLWTSR